MNDNDRMRVNRIRNRCDEAAKGSWFVRKEDEEYRVWNGYAHDMELDPIAVLDMHCGQEENAEFIAHARADILFLLELLQAREDAVARLRAERTERGNPEPLTLEQLQKMSGEPIWFRSKSGSVRCGILGSRVNHPTPYRLAVGMIYGWEWLDDMMRWGVPYAHKPSGEV